MLFDEKHDFGKLVRLFFYENPNFPRTYDI